MNTDTNRQGRGNTGEGRKNGAELRAGQVGHHTRHFSNGFIGAPIGQSKAFANSGKFCNGTFTLKRSHIIVILEASPTLIVEIINTSTSSLAETYPFHRLYSDKVW